MGKITVSTEVMDYLSNLAGKFKDTFKNPAVRIDNRPAILAKANGNKITAWERWGYSIREIKDLRYPKHKDYTDLVISFRILKNSDDTELVLDKRSKLLVFVTKSSKDNRTETVDKINGQRKKEALMASTIRSFGDLLECHKREIEFHKTRGTAFDHTNIDNIIFLAEKLNIRVPKKHHLVKIGKSKTGISKYRYTGKW